MSPVFQTPFTAAFQQQTRVLDQADVLYAAQKDLPILKKREIVYFDELEDESFDLSGKNIPTSQTMNNDRSGGDKLYSVLYTSGSTGLPKVFTLIDYFV